MGLLMCVLFGVARTFTLDEFALRLVLRDGCWEREGSFFGGLLSIGVTGMPFLEEFPAKSGRILRIQPSITS